MTSRWNVSNKLIEIAEIKIDNELVRSSLGEEADIELDLRFGKGIIEVSGVEIEVGFKSAEMYLVLDGLEVVPGPRFADENIASVVERKVTVTNSRGDKSSSGFNADLKISSNEATVSGGGTKSHQVSSEQHISSDERVMEYRVRSRPNNMWLIEGVNGAPCQGSYMTSEKLCRLRPMRGANRRSAKIVLLSRKKHIWYDAPSNDGIISKITRRSVNAEKVFKLLLAKSIGNRPQGEGTSVIEIGNYPLDTSTIAP